MLLTVKGRKEMSRDMTKPTKWLCAQRRLRSAWASAQSDQSLRCALNVQLRTQAFFMRTAKTLNRLGGCPGWSESLLGAHSFYWFCHVAAQMYTRQIENFIKFKLWLVASQFNTCTYLLIVFILYGFCYSGIYAMYIRSVIKYTCLSNDVSVIQWIMSCHKNRMTTRCITFWRVHVMS